MREQQDTETLGDNGNKDTHIFTQDTSTSKPRLIILNKRNFENCRRISKIKLHINTDYKATLLTATKLPLNETVFARVVK